MKKRIAAAVALAGAVAGVTLTRPSKPMLCVERPKPTANCHRLNPNTDKPEDIEGPFPAVQQVGNECVPVECR